MPVMLSIISALGTEPSTFFEGFAFLQKGGFIHIPAATQVNMLNRSAYSEYPIIQNPQSGNGVDISIREMSPNQVHQWSPMGGCSFIFILEGHLHSPLINNQ